MIFFSFDSFFKRREEKRREDKRKLDGTAHWEVRKGTHEQAKQYCTKELTRVEGPWEFGIDRQPGQMTDLEEIGQNAGGTLGSLSTQLQNNIGQLGNARASGYIGQANAITGGLQNITDNLFRAASLFGGGL